MISEQVAPYIWLLEMALGLIGAVVVLVVGIRRYRKAQTPAGRALAAGSIAGGILGLLGLGTLASVAVISIFTPPCGPTVSAAYCEMRTTRLRSLLVYGVAPIIVLVYLPLIVDWIAGRRIAKQKSQDLALSEISRKQDADIAQQKEIIEKIDEATGKADTDQQEGREHRGNVS